MDGTQSSLHTIVYRLMIRFFSDHLMRRLVSSHRMIGIVSWDFKKVAPCDVGALSAAACKKSNNNALINNNKAE